MHTLGDASPRCAARRRLAQQSFFDTCLVARSAPQPRHFTKFELNRKKEQLLTQLSDGRAATSRGPRLPISGGSDICSACENHAEAAQLCKTWSHDPIFGGWEFTQAKCTSRYAKFSLALGATPFRRRESRRLAKKQCHIGMDPCPPCVTRLSRAIGKPAIHK